MNSDYVIRVEGVNFGETVHNTTDLSTIRGSSLCLEAYGYELERALEKTVLPSGRRPERLFETVYCAAAQAVFRLNGVTEDEVAAFEEQARATLKAAYRQGANEPPYADWKVLQNWGNLSHNEQLRYIWTPSEHMTFVVACVPIEDGNERDAETRLKHATNRALWRNRRQQMRAPNLPRFEKKHKDLVCPIDPARYVASDAERNGAIVYGAKGQFPAEYDIGQAPHGSGALRMFETSRRSADLRTYGRDARRTVYAVTLGAENLNGLFGEGLFQTFDFVQSFEDLVSDPPDAPVSVKGKLAYLYFDGTGFGGHRAAAELKAFSDAVTGIMREVTHRLLRHFIAAADRTASNAHGYRRRLSRRKSQEEYEFLETTLLRMETLMAGGEDLNMVVPAWLGWDIAWRMLDWFRDAGRGASMGRGSTADLHFRAGLLFCDHKTPARLATAAAHALCDDAKKVPLYREQPTLSVHISEGFDVPDVGGLWADVMARERQRLFGPNLDDKRLDVVAAGFRFARSSWDETAGGIRLLKREFARSQLYKLIEELERKVVPAEDQPSAIGELLRWHDFRSANGMSQNEFLNALPGPEEMAPLNRMKLLAELWDYFEPLADGTEAGDDE